MTLKITPPVHDTSLWQAVCRDHGLILHAAPKTMTLLQARLHDFHHGDNLCRIVVGGLRCMFCQDVLDVAQWTSNVRIACPMCIDLVAHGLMRSDIPARPLSHYAA